MATTQLVVGRIGRAHGLGGEVAVEVRTDRPEQRFAGGTTLQAVLDPDRERSGSDITLTVEGVRASSGRLLVTFAGVEDRTRAEALRGRFLTVEVDDAERPEDPDEYFDHHLVGLEVVDESGVRLGRVAEVLHLPLQDALAVHDAAGREVLLPFVAAIVPTVDLAAGRLVVRPPDGLFDEPGA